MKLLFLLLLSIVCMNASMNGKDIPLRSIQPTRFDTSGTLLSISEDIELGPNDNGLLFPGCVENPLTVEIECPLEPPAITSNFISGWFNKLFGRDAEVTAAHDGHDSGSNAGSTADYDPSIGGDVTGFTGANLFGGSFDAADKNEHKSEIDNFQFTIEQLIRIDSIVKNPDLPFLIREGIVRLADIEGNENKQANIYTYRSIYIYINIYLVIMLLIES
jgi:hypothetical protein